MARELVGFTKNGSIRACGQLSTRTTDLLCGAVLELHDRGQTRIVLDLEAVQGADDSSSWMLQHPRTIVTAGGDTVIVLHPAAPWVVIGQFYDSRSRGGGMTAPRLGGVSTPLDG